MHVPRLACWLCLLGLLFCAAAGAAELPVSDFVKHATLTNPVISPDGKYLAVVIRENSGSTDASAQLAVLHLPDLKPVSRLAMAPRFVPEDIRWVSDERLIMALARDTGTLEAPSLTGDIIAVDYDGSHKRTLYSLQHRGGMFSNVNSLDIPMGYAQIAGIPRNRNGHFYLRLSRLPQGSNGDFWQDGITSLYNVDAESGHAVKVGEIRHGGMHILEYGNVARIAAGQDNNLDTVAFYSADGANWKRMPDSTVGKVFKPLAISSDGKHLYALSSMDGGPNQLIECDLDGLNRQVLASDPFSSVGTATEFTPHAGIMWNPVTGAPVAVMFGAGGKPRVQYIGDGQLVQILQALARSQPDEVVRLAGASSDGSTLLIGLFSDRNPGDFALFDRATMHARPLYQVLPWINPAQMAERMPIHFKNRDGTELVGYLTLPNGGNQKNLPLVLIPHGGPIWVSDNWFYFPWSALLANRGYATLQINYRGSGERGYNFEHSGYKQFAGGIQDDLIDGVKWAIAQGYVDPNRICVFGGSFGGYSSLMQPILAPKLYKCAIDYAGVYDWRIGMDKSDTRRIESGRRYFEDAIGSREDAYAISPVSMMDKFNVPVLIAHGKDDPRVPYQNATDLRSALDKANKPYEWLAEPKEQHGFVSEQHNEQLFTMITTFLAKYIGPGNTGAAPAASK